MLVLPSPPLPPFLHRALIRLSRESVCSKHWFSRVSQLPVRHRQRERQHMFRAHAEVNARQVPEALQRQATGRKQRQAIANSTMISVRRPPRLLLPPPVRPPSLSTSMRFKREACHAGAVPNINPDNIVISSVNTSTGMLILMSASEARQISAALPELPQ